MYGFCLWRPTKSTMHKLQALLCKPLKKALVHSHHSVATLGVLADFGVPPLHLLRQAQLLSFFHKLCNTHTDSTSTHQPYLLYRQLKWEFHYPRSFQPPRVWRIKYARSTYMEAQQSACSLLPLSVGDEAHWTLPLITTHLRSAASTYLSHSGPGTRALTLSNPYSQSLFRAQSYLLHETKPGSSIRAKFRLDIALTPAVRYRYSQALTDTCTLCTSQLRADRAHLLLHCTHYTQQRTALASALYPLGILTPTLALILGNFNTITQHPSPTPSIIHKLLHATHILSWQSTRTCQLQLRM